MLVTSMLVGDEVELTEDEEEELLQSSSEGAPGEGGNAAELDGTQSKESGTSMASEASKA